MIAGLKAARAPRMRRGIDEPRGMQADDGTREDAPKEEGQAANGEEQQAEHDHRDVLIFGDSDVEFVLGQVGDVLRERFRVVVHGFADQDPAHVRPPLAVDGGVRIAGVIGEAMMNAVRGDPEDGAAFESERGENGQKIFDPLGSAIAAMGEQTMIADADAQAGGDPPEKNGDKKCSPGEEKRRGESAQVKQHHKNTGDPVDAILFGLFLGQNIAGQFRHGPSVSPYLAACSAGLKPRRRIHVLWDEAKRILLFFYSSAHVSFEQSARWSWAGNLRKKLLSDRVMRITPNASASTGAAKFSRAIEVQSGDGCFFRPCWR